MVLASKGRLVKKFLAAVSALVLLVLWHFFPELARGVRQSSAAHQDRTATEEIPSPQTRATTVSGEEVGGHGGISGEIVHVSDGDTADFLSDEGEKMRLRFHGIDAPETSQAFGSESRRYVTSRILNKKVEVVVEGEDQYGRKVATIYLDGKNFSLELLHGGYVWHYVHYCDDPEYSSAQTDAQCALRGLWKAGQDGGYEPVPPWKFRKEHPRK